MDAILSWRALLALLSLGAVFVARAQEAVTVLELRLGIDADSQPTDLWLQAIAPFNDDEVLSDIAGSTSSFIDSDSAWFALIRDRSGLWPSLIPELLIPFPDTAPPDTVMIVVGNTGGNDAFIVSDRHIGFDARRLQQLYGDADQLGNTARIDRFFAHEFTHLLHKEWRRVRQPTIETHLEDALWACLTEGLGVYRSLSSRWTKERGVLSAHARDVLGRLEPVFAERLSHLEHATDTEAQDLFRNLSLGPFEEKWGALPVALWLKIEAKKGDEALRYWVDAGPWGIIELANRHLPVELAARLPRRPQ